MSTVSATRPPVINWLGYGGLIPFLGTALLCWLAPGQRSFWLQMLLGYGAVILSFVGALHWGFVMVHPEVAGQPMNGMYAWSVMPSLLGWVALLTHPAVGASLLIAGFLAYYRQGLRLSGLLALPAWYLPLRLQLTAVACLCLASVSIWGPALPQVAVGA